MGMGKRARRSWALQDALSKWGRHYLIYINRTGVRAGIKREARRHERREAKQDIRGERRGAI